MNTAVRKNYLIDDSSLPDLAPALRKLGYDAVNASALDIDARCDEEVFSAAHAERRVLFTQRRAFLDEQKYPPDNSSGLVILRGRHDDTLLSSLMFALSVIGKGREVWQGTIAIVSEDGRLTVKNPNRVTGEPETTHYKLRIAASPLIWTSSK